MSKLNILLQSGRRKTLLNEFRDILIDMPFIIQQLF